MSHSLLLIKRSGEEDIKEFMIIGINSGQMNSEKFKKKILSINFFLIGKLKNYLKR